MHLLFPKLPWREQSYLLSLFQKAPQFSLHPFMAIYSWLLILISVLLVQFLHLLPSKTIELRARGELSFLESLCVPGTVLITFTNIFSCDFPGWAPGRHHGPALPRGKGAQRGGGTPGHRALKLWSWLAARSVWTQIPALTVLPEPFCPSSLLN